ncbi:hypothetical protein JW968_07275 [Candidatus Woesearchaeota archaeon]|nr:hypothetical protein [Candidatus Woesearchaeota archaeon]
MAKNIFFLILILVLIIPAANGIRGTSDLLNRNLNVELGKSHEYEYTIINNQKIPQSYSITFQDRGGGKTDLNKYFSAEPASIPELKPMETFTFKVKVNFFEDSEHFGQHVIKMSVTEGNTIEGALTVKGSLAFLFSLHVLHPGLLAETRLNARDIGENETEITTVSISNKGKIMIEDAHAELRFYNSSGGLVHTADTSKVSLNSFQSHNWDVRFPMGGYPPGKYSVEADVHYNEITENLNDSYLVGTRQLKINNHTKEIYSDMINKFEFEVESLWNGELKDVWGEVTFNGVVAKTSPITLGPFGKGNLSTYLDANGVNASAYPIQLRAYYGERITEKDSLLAVLEKTLHRPMFLQYFNITNLLLLILTLIMLIFLILRVQDRKEMRRYSHKAGGNDPDFDELEGDAPKPDKKKKAKKLEAPKHP